MAENIINVTGLKKVYQVHRRNKEGFLPALKSLVKREYQQVNAVDGIDFQVEAGEIRGLIGPNGAGKSTTIKILCGILHPTEGEVRVMGYTPWSEREEYVRNIGAVFGQKSQLIWELPAIDTFSLSKEMYRIPELKFRENLEYFNELLQIGEVIKKPVRQLSLGERMKCELVCALLHEPRLVYLDEPTIGLDIISKDSIRKFIKEANRDKQITFIVTTHDLDDIENLCERITIINYGKIVFNDSLAKLTTFFSNKKLIEVKFKEQVSQEKLIGFQVVTSDSFSANIEVELDGKDLQSEVSKIFGALPVHDINISNIAIEDVIKQIYSG
ncbi:MAG: ABC transporter ATP-binding protein [Bacteroidota bacterium]